MTGSITNDNSGMPTMENPPPNAPFMKQIRNTPEERNQDRGDRQLHVFASEGRTFRAGAPDTAYGARSESSRELSVCCSFSKLRSLTDNRKRRCLVMCRDDRSDEFITPARDIYDEPVSVVAVA